jgi:hypothetical protein
MIPPDDALPDDNGHSHQDPHLDPLETSLEELKDREKGLSFVYGALDLISGRHELTDAVVVLVNESLGTQIFRLGGKRVPTWSADRLAPGLYCWPDSVPSAERELVYRACQQAFSEHVLRRSAATERSGSGARSGPHELHPSSPLEGLDASSGVTDEIEDATGVSARGLISRALLFIDVAAFFTSVADGHGVLRYVLGLVLGVVIPGWSVVGLLKLNNAALEFALTVAASLAMVMVAAQILITVHLWHPIVLEELTCLLCAPALLLQSQVRGTTRWTR